MGAVKGKYGSLNLRGIQDGLRYVVGWVDGQSEVAMSGADIPHATGATDTTVQTKFFAPVSSRHSLAKADAPFARGR